MVAALFLCQSLVIPNAVSQTTYALPTSVEAVVNPPPTPGNPSWGGASNVATITFTIPATNPKGTYYKIVSSPGNRVRLVSDADAQPRQPKCNMPLYRKILSDCSDQIKQYFPNREISNIQEEVKRLAQNKFSVINCSVDDLESHLRKLGIGRKQIAISRYEDQVTVIVNDLDVIY